MIFSLSYIFVVVGTVLGKNALCAFDESMMELQRLLFMCIPILEGHTLSPLLFQVKASVCSSVACERRRISGCCFSPEIRLRSQASSSVAVI